MEPLLAGDVIEIMSETGDAVTAEVLADSGDLLVINVIDDGRVFCCRQQDLRDYRVFEPAA
jgi:hypothetical protein